jgi:hypothetical protein
VQFTYDASRYLPSLLETCLARRRGNRERWLTQGGKIGSIEREWRWFPGIDGAAEDKE